MEKVEAGYQETMLKGEATIWQCIFGYVDGMALKCVVELVIPDIINSHGCPLSLSSISKSINLPSLDTDRLSRMSLAPLLMLQYHTEILESWHQFSDIVKEGGNGFARSHGLEFWDFISVNSEVNTLFNKAMDGISNIIVEAMKTSCKDGFNRVGLLVDVGGGSGAMVAEIVKPHPHIKRIHLDLPHVVATAPECEGVTHIAGDMFKSIPATDTILMKHTRLIYNPLMMIHFQGKERSEPEWKQLLEEGGFSSYKIIKIPALLSVIV
uniref:O-methyltransferase domain-containing protein n=1 Tax=Manihot esculenta TaxID=3983 RepID=A0A2C9UNB8_MANES